MSDFYCNVCGEKVKLVDGKCPKCKTDWNKIIKDCVESDKGKPIDLSDNSESIDLFDKAEERHLPFLTSEVELSTEENADIDDVCSFLLKYGNIGKVILIIASGIVIIFSLIMFVDSDGISLIYTVIGVLGLFIAFLFEAMIKWHVYLLLTNKKINNGISKLVKEKEKKK